METNEPEGAEAAEVEETEEPETEYEGGSGGVPATPSTGGNRGGTAANAAYSLFRPNSYCTATGLAESENFMNWHIELPDTEDPQTCANYARAEMMCSQYFMTGSVYTFCACIKAGTMCEWDAGEAENELEDHGSQSTIYQLLPGPVLSETHKSEPSSDLDPIMIAGLLAAGMVAGSLSFLL